MSSSTIARNSQLLDRMDSLGREYVKFIESLESITPLDRIAFTQEFKDFRKSHLINFNNASIVDLYFFGYCGNYWISAYEHYLNDNENYSNSKTGILTFNMW